MTDDARFLEFARAEARQGIAEGGIPIGAALVRDGVVLGSGHNRRVQMGSAIRHGETNALERAGRQAATTYRDSTMVTTLSPCDMCTGEAYLRSRGVEVVVLDDPECVSMMERFIAENPVLWNEDIGV